MNEYIFSQIQKGMTASFSKEITTDMEDMFRKISGDINPLHESDEFARELSNGKYKQHVTFGMLTASLYSTIAGVYLPGKYSLIHSMEIKFQKPVYVGDILTVEGTVIDKQEELKLLQLRVKITNQDGKCVSKADMKVLVQK